MACLCLPITFIIEDTFFSFLQGLSLALSTNTIGPLLMAKHFVPLLLKGTGTFGAQSTDKSKQHSAILINMSAKVGSITDNGKNQ